MVVVVVGGGGGDGSGGSGGIFQAEQPMNCFFFKSKRSLAFLYHKLEGQKKQEKVGKGNKAEF